MKRLKFVDPLPSMILSGVKYTTWRINDEKNIVVGDVLSLCGVDGREFARGKVYSINVTTFGNLSDEDKEGHEPYASEEEMYNWFSGHYGVSVTPNTAVKVIKFKLVKK